MEPPVSVVPLDENHSTKHNQGIPRILVLALIKLYNRITSHKRRDFKTLQCKSGQSKGFFQANMHANKGLYLHLNQNKTNLNETRHEFLAVQKTIMQPRALSLTLQGHSRSNLTTSKVSP